MTVITEVYKPLGLMWADFSKEKLEEFYALEEDEDEQIRSVKNDTCKTVTR